MLRTLAVLILLIPFCLSGLVIWPVLGILYLFDKKLPRTFAFYFVRFACRIGIKLGGVRLSVSGLENIPADHAAYFVMNHRGIFDIICTYALMKRPTGFIAKKQLARVPFFAQWFRLSYSLFLDRNDIRKGMETIRKAITYLNDGISMCIFPEGTRNRDQESKTSLIEFHTGSFHPVKKTGVPIIPVAIYNTAECLENHYPWIRSTDVKIIFGTPVRPENLSEKNRRGICDYTRGIIQEMLNSCENG